MKRTSFIRILGAVAFAITAMAAHGQSLTAYNDLHDFGGSIKNAGGSSGPDGAGPWSSITFDAAGNMVGTTAYGGAYGRGLLWKLTKAGTYVDLHDFGGTVTNTNGSQGPDGEIPYGGVTFDSSGNMYGTTLFGGPYGNANGYSGIVWEITKAGKYIDLHDFGGWTTNANGSGGPDGGNPCGGVTLDAAGNLYGTASAGAPYDQGIDGAGNVWEITTDGTYVDLHDFGGTVTNANGTQGPDAYMPYAGVTFDAAGNMYGTASKAGPYVGGNVWEITKGGTYIDLHDFGGTVSLPGNNQWPDGETPYGWVTIDSVGNLYGTTVAGGAHAQGILWRLSSGGTYVDLHDFGGTVTNANGSSGPDGRNPYAGVTFDPSGNLVGTTAYGGPNNWAGYSAGMIWEMTKAGGYVDLHDFGGKIATAGGTLVQDGTRPWYGVTFDAAGILYGVAAYGGPNGEGGLGDGSGMVWSLFQTTIQGVAISPASVIGGTSTTGTVTLGAAAPWTGAALPLFSSSASAVPPAVLLVPAGSSTGSFTVSTVAVNVKTTATITVGKGPGSKSATLTIEPVVLSSLTLSPTIIGGGGTSTGTVTLPAAAPTGGAIVSLTSSSTSATAPATVIIQGGKTSGTFTITTKAVSASVTATITASLNGGTQSATLTITLPTLSSVAVSPSSVTGGSTSIGTVTLSGNALPGGFVVALSSSNAVVTVPKTVTIGAGANSVTFAVTTKAVATSTTATLTAKNGSTSKTAVLAIVPPTLTALKLSPATVGPGGSSTGTVTLSGPAPVGGLIVSISSSSTKVTAPAKVTIAAGQTSASFSVKTTKTTPAGSVTLTATQAGVSQAATLTVS
jgi:uncharacterized repeat protein (TIGR03803 family)